MSVLRLRWLAAAVAVLVLCGGRVLAQEAKTPGKEAASFGTLEAIPADQAKAKALEWLKEVGKSDAASLKEFEAIWSADKVLLEKVSDTFALGDPEAKKLLAEGRDFNLPPPTEVPAVLKDTKKSAFFRANLALAYAKALSNRRIQEEALDALKTVRPEQVVDPGAYLFTRAVAEYSLLKKEECGRSILRLLDDVPDAPERYKTVGALMAIDMQSWREKDLGWVSRMMGNIERRLDLTRGGPITQDMQKKVVIELDAMIKKLEEEQQQANGQGQGQGQQGRQPGNNNRPSSPQQDSYGGNNSGPGEAEMKKWRETAENWGKLPEKERAKAMLELTKDMPPKHRELIEAYFKKLAQTDSMK